MPTPQEFHDYDLYLIKTKSAVSKGEEKEIVEILSIFSQLRYDFSPP
jgi:hypothetical protein